MESKPLRIVILLQDLEFGGTQRYAVNLLRRLDRDLFAPELWVLRRGDDMLDSALETGANITFLSRSTYVGPRALSNLAWKLYRFPPDLIYTLTVVPNIWGRTFARLTRVPVIVSGYRNLFPKQYERLLWRLSHRIICNAEASKRALVDRYGAHADVVAVIPNGVDTDYFSPAREQRAPSPTVVFVGRLVRQKDPLNLVKAFRRAAHTVAGSRYLIVGNGPLKPKLEEFVRTNNLGSAIELHPGTDDIRPLLWRSWVFTMASISESSPNVVVEAMATGLPVVSTRVGGIPELVQHGETGLLVDPNNPEQLADSLAELLRNETRREAMGSKARTWAVAHYSLKNLVRRTEQVFLEAVREAEKRRE
jgi:glycosyltransferase involved in cell wall biosynthesis